MWPALTNAVAQAYGMGSKACKCQANTVDSTVRHIRTGLGVLKGSYGNTTNVPKIQRKIQGKGDVASFCAMISSTLLAAYAMIYTVLFLPGVYGKNNIKKNNDAFIDDVDTYAGSLDNGPQTAAYVMV